MASGPSRTNVEMHVDGRWEAMVFELSTCDWITRCVLMPGIKSLIVYNNNAAVEGTDVFIEETRVNNVHLSGDRDFK